MRSLVSIGAALGGMMLLAGGASALPLDRPPAATEILPVAEGCGPGWFRNNRGVCRPMRRGPAWDRPMRRGPAWDRPGWRGPGWRGERCFIRQTPWGPRRVCR